jgi:hypothetical protein
VGEETSANCAADFISMEVSVMSLMSATTAWPRCPRSMVWTIPANLTSCQVSLRRRLWSVHVYPVASNAISDRVGVRERRGSEKVAAPSFHKRQSSQRLHLWISKTLTTWQGALRKPWVLMRIDACGRLRRGTCWPI